MCMICDGKGNVLVQDKTNSSNWCGWIFPDGHVEKGEYVTPSVIREIREETRLIIEKPRLCGIKEFHKSKDGKRYIVFLYIADKFVGDLKASGEGEVFWYPLDELVKSDKLIAYQLKYEELVQKMAADEKIESEDLNDRL